MNLPETGRPVAELLADVTRMKAHDLPVRGGQVTAYVYDTGRPEVHEAAAAAYFEMLEVNCLDPTAFPSIVEMEQQVVGAVADLLGGGHGIFTSGGTESIMLAVKAARDLAGRTGGNLVLPVTAHPAFHKAAHYLGLEVRAVPVDLETFKVTASAIEREIDEDTVLVVASAPSYPQGVLDPIAEVAAVASAAGVPFHVDACVGGWLLPWLREAGASVPAFDFSVPGVTSISCDLHKFGYAPKGLRSCSSPILRCGARRTSPRRPGPVTRSSTRPCRARARPGRWAGPGPRCRRWGGTGTPSSAGPRWRRRAGCVRASRRSPGCG